MMLDHPNRVLWAREESLASIQQAKMIDLPVQGNQLNDEKGGRASVVDMFVKVINKVFDLNNCLVGF